MNSLIPLVNNQTHTRRLRYARRTVPTAGGSMEGLQFNQQGEFIVSIFTVFDRDY